MCFSEFKSDGLSSGSQERGSNPAPEPLRGHWRSHIRRLAFFQVVLGKGWWKFPAAHSWSTVGDVTGVEGGGIFTRGTVTIEYYNYISHIFTITTYIKTVSITIQNTFFRLMI